MHRSRSTHGRRRRWIASIAALLVAGHATAADSELPWLFNAPRAEGYAIDLVSIEPAPGTPLVRGETVTFEVTVASSLSIADKGRVLLVFQDDRDRSATEGQTQVSTDVARGQATTSLRQAVVVPAHARELRLFIPLVPDGVESTTGEITVRYPIVKKKP